MQRRTDGRRLPHRAVTEKLLVDFHRREQQRNRRTGQQVFDREFGGQADTPMAQPGIDGAAALVEGHRLARFVTEGRDRHRLQVLLRDRLTNAGQLQLIVQQLPQRRTVEQRHRHLRAQAEQAVTDEPGGLADHPGPVAADHLMAAKALPERRETLDGRGEIQRAAGQADRVDRPGRGPDNHWKRIARPRRQQLGNCRQYPHLICRTSPTAGKNQSCDRFRWAHRYTPWR